MITISHAQARRLIHAQCDGLTLPEEQWTFLHAHLETCPDCCAYQAGLLRFERRLRRALRLRWDPADRSPDVDARRLAWMFLQQRAARRAARWMLSAAAAFLLGVMLFITWSDGEMENAQSQPPAAAAATLTPTPSPTPTRVPSDYRGVIAYEARPAADPGGGSDPGGGAAAGEIYLLNAGAEPANLTNHPADDRAPAWSPDGEWLAFLSDRDGKDEVYVMHISGSRLTRLTDLPEVAWQGPLSWSSDGQMLALVGERRIGETTNTWVYLVSLDGTNAYPLGTSSGALRAAFSPAPGHTLLAFSSSVYWSGGLAFYDFAPPYEQLFAVDPVLSSSEAASSSSQKMVGLLDWAADGTRVLFHSARPASGSEDARATAAGELRAVDLAEVYDLESYGISSQVMKSISPEVGYASIAWTGIKDEIAYLVDADNSGCQTLTVEIGGRIKRGQRKAPALQVDGLCVAYGLERANWRVNDKSVLVGGYLSDRADGPGLYIVRFSSGGPHIEWLVDAPGLAGTPRLRPSAPRSPARRLAIDPRPVQAAAEVPPSPLPGRETGDLLAVTTLNERTLIDRLDPASSRRTTINQSFGTNSCPAWSPDRNRIAFLSDRASDTAGLNEVFVMDGSGLNVRQLTLPRFPSRRQSDGFVFPHYECPVWSPDGRWLAALVFTLDHNYAAVIPLDERDGPPRYIAPETRMGTGSLAWLPDGRLLVTYSGPGGNILRAYDPARIRDGQNAEYTDLLHSDGWAYHNNLVLAPDGRTLALAAWRLDSYEKYTIQLLAVPLDALPSGAQPGYADITQIYEIPDNFGSLVYDSIHWLLDGRLAFVVSYPAGRRVKAELLAVQPDGSGSPELIAAFTDIVQSAVWSADGQWLTAITEAGRYVVNVSQAPAAPTWIDGETGKPAAW